MIQSRFGSNYEAKTMNEAIKRELEKLKKREEDQARDQMSETSLDEINLNYPKLSDLAVHGLSGEIVRIIEPHTEADPAALLVQLLAGFGSLINKTAYFRAGADFHYTKIFAVLVGA